MHVGAVDPGPESRRLFSWMPAYAGMTIPFEVSKSLADTVPPGFRVFMNNAGW